MIQTLEKQSEFEQYLNSVPEDGYIALDTEFVREKTYYPQAGLIQIEFNNEIVCADPLAIKDLSLLFEVLANPSITKIIHAAGQDLELLYSLSPTPIRNIFDTQIAANLLAQGDQIGYAGLVKLQLGLELEKSQTRTNWLARPLSSRQLQYAADDVRYLGEIHTLQLEQLEISGRLSWLVEDCDALIDKQHQPQSPDQLLLRIKGQQELAGVDRAIARELAIWREQQAKSRDLPRRWILADDLLIQITKQKPGSIENLRSTGALTEKQLKSYADQIVLAIKTGKELNQDDWPASTESFRLSPELKEKLKTVKQALNKIAAEENLVTPLLANRKMLEQLVQGNTSIPLMRGWRYEVAGSRIENLLD